MAGTWQPGLPVSGRDSVFKQRGLEETRPQGQCWGPPILGSSASRLRRASEFCSRSAVFLEGALQLLALLI